MKKIFLLVLVLSFYLTNYGQVDMDNLANKAVKPKASINIPNTVTSIGNQAFHGCSSLKSIIIPDFKNGAIYLVNF